MLISKVHHFFLFFTWALHFAFIILLVGTPVLALLERLRGRQEGPAWSFWRTYYPICISLTITTGIAPLLFNQTLFHRGFYQSFINLYPLPLIGLVMLIVFFYLAYAIKHSEKLALPLTFVQIGFLWSFMLFFNMIYSSIVSPDHWRPNFWGGEWPNILWHAHAGYVVAALIGAAIFFAMHKRSWTVRAIPLLIIGFVVSAGREFFRLRALGDRFPAPLHPQVDISIVVFLLSFLVMIWVLIVSFRIAFPRSSSG